MEKIEKDLKELNMCELKMLKQLIQYEKTKRVQNKTIRQQAEVIQQQTKVIQEIAKLI